MPDRLSKPKNSAQWLRWVESELYSIRVALRRKVPVPVGGMILWPVGIAVPPGPWLRANGATFTSTDWPVLAQRLGSTTLPNPAAVSTHTWLIRAG